MPTWLQELEHQRRQKTQEIEHERHAHEMLETELLRQIRAMEEQRQQEVERLQPLEALEFWERDATTMSAQYVWSSVLSPY